LKKKDTLKALQQLDGYAVKRFHADNALLKFPLCTNTFGMSIVCRGSIRLNIGNKEFLLAQDMFFFHTPTTVLEVLETSAEFEVITLMFSLNFGRRIGIFFDAKSPFSFLFEHYLQAFPLNANLSKRLCIYMDNLKDLNTSNFSNKNRIDIIRNTFALINYEIEAELMENIIHQVSLSNRKEKLCLDFINLVFAQFKTHRSVQYYADVLCVSRKYLSRVVKEISDLTPLQIIEQTLLLEVIALLRSDLYAISEIVQQLNFTNLPSFSKFFKKNTGNSPMSYRRDILL